MAAISVPRCIVTFVPEASGHIDSNGMPEALQQAPSRLSAAIVQPGVRPLTVVADSSGFVGAFTNETKAKEFITPYATKGVPFVLYNFTIDTSVAEQSRVFVVPYRGSDAVAFVSNDIARCRKVHTVLNAIGLTYEDDISFWEHPVDVPCAPAVKRLDTFLEGLRLYGADDAKAASDAEEKEKRLFEENEDGPLSRMIRENEKICILSEVVPVGPDSLFAERSLADTSTTALGVPADINMPAETRARSEVLTTNTTQESAPTVITK